MFMSALSLFVERKEVKKKNCEKKTLKAREKNSTAKRKWKETISYAGVS